MQFTERSKGVFPLKFTAIFGTGPLVDEAWQRQQELEADEIAPPAGSNRAISEGPLELTEPQPGETTADLARTYSGAIPSHLVTKQIVGN